MKKFEVSILDFKELPANLIEEYELAEDDFNWRAYILVTHNDEVILFRHDSMEPEDATFNRDLSWIAGAIQNAYELGLKDGKNNEC